METFEIKTRYTEEVIFKNLSAEELRNQNQFGLEFPAIKIERLIKNKKFNVLTNKWFIISKVKT